MKLEMMAIYDSAAGAFLPPFFVASTAIALRQLRALSAGQPAHDFVRYADQYTLYTFGSFDNESGAMIVGNQTSLGSLQVICRQLELPMEDTK